MIGSKLDKGDGAAEQLGDGSRREQFVRVMLKDRVPIVAIDDEYSPTAMLVFGPSEDLFEACVEIVCAKTW